MVGARPKRSPGVRLQECRGVYGNGFPCSTKEKGLGSRESVQLSGGPKYQRRRRRRRSRPQHSLHAAHDTAEKGRGLVPVRRVSRSDRYE